MMFVGVGKKATKQSEITEFFGGLLRIVGAAAPSLWSSLTRAMTLGVYKSWPKDRPVNGT